MQATIAGGANYMESGDADMDQTQLVPIRAENFKFSSTIFNPKHNVFQDRGN